MNYEKVIILFKDKSDRKVVEDVGGVISNEINHLSRILIAEVPTNSLSLLESNPLIKTVEKCSSSVAKPTINIKDINFFNYNNFEKEIEVMDVHNYWSRGLTGKGVNVAVIDSGVGHRDGILHVTGGYDINNPSGSGYTIDSSPVSHGTTVAYVLAGQPKKDGEKVMTGVAPDVNLYSVKVQLTPDYMLPVSEILIGMDWCIGNNIDIIVASFNGSTDPALFESVVADAVNSNVLIVNSAGNSDTEIMETDGLATIDGVVVVSGLEFEYQQNIYIRDGSYGQYLDFLAPSSGIRSIDKYFSNVRVNGTSYSAPIVAGIFAMYKQAFPNKSNTELYDIIKNSAKKIDGQTDDWDEYHGWGIPQPSPEILNLPFDLDYYIPELPEGVNFRVYDDGTVHAKGKIINRDGELSLILHEQKEDVHGLRNSSVLIGKNVSMFNVGNHIIIGNNAKQISGSSSSSVIIGDGAEGKGISVAIGLNAKTSGYYRTIAVGDSAVAGGESALSIGSTANTRGSYSTAIGAKSSALNSYTGMLGSSDANSTNHWIVPGNFTTEGTKNFEMSHPKPEKKNTHRIRHSAVETNTAGDNLYRFKVNAVKNADIQYIELPDYFIHLNKNVQIFVTPQGHFGNGYGELNITEERLEIHCQFTGEYNVLVIGTRNDDHQSVQDWDIKGVEREIGESWTGETYAFEVDEIIEINEIKEEVF